MSDTDTQTHSLPRVIEAILFASQKAVSTGELLSILKASAQAAKEDPVVAALAKTAASEIEAAARILADEYKAAGLSFELRETAAGWQLVSRPDYAPWLRQLYPELRPARLSAPALETLAIIAYRQPITRADIEAIRGVSIDGVLQTILDRGLVRIAGRADVPGRPLLYETTQFFMEHFGLKNLDDLPNSDELRRLPLPQSTPAPQDELPLEHAPASNEEPAPEEPAS